MPGLARFALHTWTLDSTPAVRVLEIARATGWPAVELRRIDFLRERERAAGDVGLIEAARAIGSPTIACVGAERGWMFCDEPERVRLMDVLAESCRWAKILGASVVMSPVDEGRGDLEAAARRVRDAGAVAAAFGVRLAIEPDSQCAQLNTLERARELLARAGHPSTGLLLDSYHLHRSGSWHTAHALAVDEIAYVQFSDVPASGLRPGYALDRLPAGRGTVPFRDFFALLRDKGYSGYMSYEAPNPEAWARDAETVAREALAAASTASGR